MFSGNRRNPFRANHRVRRFVGDERGQATLEYVLLLAIVVAIFLILKRTLFPVIRGMSERFSSQLQRMWNPEGLHKINIGR